MQPTSQFTGSKLSSQTCVSRGLSVSASPANRMDAVSEFGVRTGTSQAEKWRSLPLRFVAFLTSVFCVFGSFFTLLYLQSSINIEDGLGATATTVLYVTSIISSLSLTPFLLKKYGAKISMLLGQVGYFIYICSNFYPSNFTLIPAGALAGLAEATIWPAALLFTAHHAKRYHLTKRRDLEFYLTEFTGYFFFIVELSRVFGNLLAYGLFFRKGPSNTSSSSNQSHTTSGQVVLPGLEVCGANDCQEPNVTNLNLHQYVPASQDTLYVILGCLSGASVLGMAITLLCFDNIDRKRESSVRSSDEITSENNVAGHSLQNSQQVIEEQPTAIVGTTAAKLHSDDDSQGTRKTWHEQKSFTGMIAAIKATFNQMIVPKQLFISPLVFYSGLAMSFTFSELTRAFASCTMGVREVSLCMAIFSATSGLSAFINGKISSRIGRNPPMFVAFFINIGYYMTCLFWNPQNNNLWLVYILFVMCGITEGVWKPTVNAMHGTKFPDNKAIAFNVWNLWHMTSHVVQFGYSTSLCVREKLYIQIAVLCLSVTSYGVGELAETDENVHKINCKSKQTTGNRTCSISL